MKKQLTRREKCAAAVRGFFGKYRYGVDFLAIGLFAVLLLPTIVWACWSPGNDVLRAAPTDALEVCGYIFEAISVVLLVFIVRREKRVADPSSPFFIFALLSVILYLVAWVFYFCAYVNNAVLIFMTVLPCTALGCFAALRRDLFVFPPLAVFFALHLARTCIYLL